MASIPQPPSTNAAILAALAAVPPQPPANTYEVALVLGGTVSAGAYTAGAVDFLVEALDSWTRLRDSGNPSAPKHNVVLRTVTGTSGGGVCAAIAARALAFDFPHTVRATLKPGPENPFYDVWVNQLDLKAMLDNGDLATKTILSLLNGKCIDEGAAFIENFGATSQPKKRSYIADPLRVILTLTNLRGIPYTTDFGAAPQGATTSGMRQVFVDHADFARFDIVYPGQSFSEPRGDEWTLTFGGQRLPQMAGWSDLSLYARATSAFPVGFPPRILQRPLEHYRYRAAILPGNSNVPAEVSLLIPDWATIKAQDAGQPASTDYTFISVDGGGTDNEPIELARTTLSGLLGRNPRDGLQATRGVLLIDPFAGDADLGPEKADGLLSLGGGLISALIQQTRYDSSDILLAQHPEVYSRFMISAARDGLVGNKALATAGLGAFIGFACHAFRRHDYFLGRANAQAYLKNLFVLPAASPVFTGCWSPKQEQDHEVVDAAGNRFLPLIPLLGDAAIPESTEPFPKFALDPEIFRDAIESRFKAIVEIEGQGGLVSSVASWILAHLGEGKVADVAIDQMKKALTDWGLA